MVPFGERLRSVGRRRLGIRLVTKKAAAAVLTFLRYATRFKTALDVRPMSNPHGRG